MLKCCSCGNVANLIRAHIIPEAFFRAHREEHGAPLIVSGVKGQLPKRSPIGVYDTEILCKNCEAQLSNPDSYGIDILLKRFPQFFSPMNQFGRTVAFESPTVDKSRLLHFLIAVLWRASVSKNDFYKHVKLGTYEAYAKKITFGDGSIPFGVFDAVLSKWRDDENIGLVSPPLLDPYRERWKGVNAYRVYFGEIVAYIKVDSQPFPESLSVNSLLNAPVVRIVSRNIATSGDFDAMVNTVSQSSTNKQLLKAKQKK